MREMSAPAREEDLYRIWPSLAGMSCNYASIDGKTIQILECGTRNHDAGPDFLNALVRIDGTLLRGHVEIHLSAADWFAHHHHSDRRYNRVLLHLVHHPCPAQFQALHEDGTAAVTMSLQDQTATTFPVTIHLEPHAAFHCALAERELMTILAHLDHRGHERFRQQQACFLELRPNQEWEQIFYYGLLSGLGYGKNGIPFRRLAFVLPVSRLWDSMRDLPEDQALEFCEAMIFAAAGILPDPGEADDSASQNYPERLVRQWEKWRGVFRIVPMQPEEWQFFRLRPNNFPTRRLAALARLVKRCSAGGFIKPVLSMLHAVEMDSGACFRSLEIFFQVTAEGYWQDHYHFGNRALALTGKRPAYLIGRGRSRNLLINIVLPLLAGYACESEDGRLNAGVHALYAGCPPGEDNLVLRRMYRQLFAQQSDGPINTLAVHEQGMMQLAQRWCGRDRCDECVAG